MKHRLNPYKASAAAMAALSALDKAVSDLPLELGLLDLVKTRASQINGCAYCLHLHTAEARAHGEVEARLYLLDAWRESPLYTDRERAALGWTEAVTLVSASHVPDDVFAAAREHFSEEELVNLTLVVTTINAWNRFGISFRAVHPVNTAAHAA